MIAEWMRPIPSSHKKRSEGVGTIQPLFYFFSGNVEKSRQRRSRRFAVLSYAAYAPRVKTAAALLDGLF